MWTPHQRAVLTLYRAALNVARKFPLRSLRSKTCYNIREIVQLHKSPKFSRVAPKLIQQGWEDLKVLEELAKVDLEIFQLLCRKDDALDSRE